MRDLQKFVSTLRAKKMGYNKITKLNIKKPNSNEDTPKVETTSKENIRKVTKEFFQ